VNLTEKSAHLAWCALVALALARQNGDVVSPVQENLFLTRWLATALKQRRFSRDVAPDIEWLRNRADSWASMQLARKLNYLCSSSGELSAQNDLFRLTHALETAKDMCWNYRYAVTLNDSINGIYLSRSSLDAAFDDDGRQINPLIGSAWKTESMVTPVFATPILTTSWLA
jgi:hypothetical protein